MTVGLFVDSFYPNVDGVVVMVDSMARMLANLGHIVFVVTTSNETNFEQLPYQVVCCPEVKAKGWYYGLARGSKNKKFVSQVLHFKPDVVHIHSPFAIGKLGVRVAKKLGLVPFATFHSQFHQDFYHVTKSKLLTKWAVKRVVGVFSQCQTVFVMSKELKELLFSYGYKGKTCMLPNFTKHNYPQNADQLAQRVNQAYGLQPNDVVFLYVGRLVELKGVLFLMQVLLQLKNKLHFTMFFVGDGKDKQKMEQFVKENGLQNQVVFCGKILDEEWLQAHYVRAHLFLFPSLYDNDSLVQKEAAICKTATLFAENAITAHGVNDGVNGFLAPYEPNAYANKMLQILNQPNQLTLVENNAYLQALEAKKQFQKTLLKTYSNK